MNVVEIVKVLQNKINNTTSKEELIFLSKSLENLNLGLVKTVSTYADLLNIKYPIEGELYFVENEERLYYGFGPNWFLVFKQANLPLYAWGGNILGELGDGTTSTRGTPTVVLGGFTDWTFPAITRSRHSAGIRANGTMWTWGGNSFGELGDGTTTSRLSPVSVVGGINDWVYAEQGASHTLGIRSNGTLWIWGRNDQGQVGDGTTTARSSPVSVIGGFTDWIQASTSAGGNQAKFSAGVRKNGTLWTWGLNTDGQLGNGTQVGRNSPGSVVGGFTDWTYVSCGTYSVLGLRSNGTLWGWGRQDNGEIGDGTTAKRSSPVSVIGGFTDWVQVRAGGGHTIALRSNGTLWAWGRNQYGQIGDGTTSNRSSPVSVVGGFTDWVSFGASSFGSIGLRSNGTIWTWGTSPVSVAGFTDWLTVAGGYDHRFAIRSI